MKNIYLVVSVIVIIPICTVILNKMEVSDAHSEIEMYCEMVTDWKASNGQRGWPDYNGVYEQECKKGL